MSDKELLDMDLLGYEEEEDTQKDKFLIFCLDNEFYGIEIKYVIEIIGMLEITEVPELPNYIRGITNLRGKIIPLMDVRLRFKKPFREYNDKTCVIVVDIKNVSVGLIVDSVSEVLSIPEANIAPPPKINKESKNRYIKGIGKTGDGVKLLLDCYKLLNDEEIDDLSNL